MLNLGTDGVGKDNGVHANIIPGSGSAVDFLGLEANAGIDLDIDGSHAGGEGRLGGNMKAIGEGSDVGLQDGED